MILTDSITKLNTTVIYLSRNQAPGLEGSGLLLGADLIGLGQIIDAPEAQPSPEGLAILSMRNQLTVTISPNRLVFGDASGEKPTREDFPLRVARASDYIGSLSNQMYATVGLNFDIEFKAVEEELPSHAMLHRLIKGDVLVDTGYDVVGASTRLWYVANDRRHDLRIEPRGNQYDGTDYYAHLNAHIELGNEMPSEEWLSQALIEEYSDFMRVLQKFLEPIGKK